MKNKITSFFVVLIIFFSPLFLLDLKGDFFIFSASAVENVNSPKIVNELLVKYKNSNVITQVKIGENENKDLLLADFKDNSKVEYAEPNHFYRISTIPNDVYYNQQWYLKKIKAPDAWGRVEQNDQIVIAIIDSGIQIDHPDLKDNIFINKDEVPNNKIDDDRNGFIDDYNGWDFILNSPDPSPKFEKNYSEAGVLHGTIIAGIAAGGGNNQAGISGVAWKSKIMPLRVLDDRGEGRTSEVVKAIDYAIKNGADILNLSFVGLGYSQTLYEAIQRAYEADVIIVAAAGNEYHEGEGYNLDETSMYPVCYDGKNGENMVIGVAATDSLDQKANFSSYGSRCIDILAPGVSIFSSVVYNPVQSVDGKTFNKYYDGYWSGTSMATPIVSGAIALIEQANPNISRDRVVEVLLSSTDNINRLNPNYLGKIGQGRLNLERAVIMATSEIATKQTFLVVAPFANYESLVKITDLKGNIKSQFFAYDKNFRGGVNVASGDIDGDGKDEIITGAGAGGGPQVRVFDIKGNIKSQFFAYDKNFRGGVNVASGNIDGGARNIGNEIITSPGKGGGPHIKIFDRYTRLKEEFFAYGNKYYGGVQLAVGDINQDGKIEIITGTGPMGVPYVRVFDINGKFFASFYAFPQEKESGVNLSVNNQ
jgi:subtilisin family serine protease